MNRYRLWTLLCLVVLMGTVVVFAGCSGMQTMSERDSTRRGFLQLLVEPDHAEIFIDSEYQGLVSGWLDGVIPVRPGVQRLELRADGYMTQRFDLSVAANEQVTLELFMERELEDHASDPEDFEHGRQRTTIP